MHVTLHLTCGDLIPLEMTRNAKERLSRTLNRPLLPEVPLVLEQAGETLEIPWRAIGYISSSP